MRRLKDESGQSLVIAALCMTCLMGFVALATDLGIMLHEKRLIQTAADSAAIAGASELGFADVTAAAQSASGLNGFATLTAGVTVTVNNPPLNGPYASSLTKANYVEVIVSQSQPTFFMRLFGRNAMNISARAVATVGSGRNCMYLLGPAGTDILLSGTGSLHVPDCGILVDSNSSTGAITDSGTGSITAQSIGIVASAPGVNNSGTGHVNAPPNSPPVTGMAPVSDPLASIVQPSVPSSCISFSSSGTSPVPLSPGCYSKLSITGTGAVTLSSGLYILNGPVTLTGTGSITGNNVTLYVTSAAGAVSITGTQPVNLSAPTSGVYNGILLFQERGDTNPFTITGTGNLNLTGIFYVPSAPVLLTGTGNATYNAAFVTNQLQDTGTGNVTLTNFALTNSSTPLTAVRLVE